MIPHLSKIFLPHELPWKVWEIETGIKFQGLDSQYGAHYKQGEKRATILRPMQSSDRGFEDYWSIRYYEAYNLGAPEGIITLQATGIKEAARKALEKLFEVPNGSL